MAEETSDQPQKRQFVKRPPSVATKISKLSKEMNRISLTGTVVSKNKELYSFVLDDGSGTVLVITNNIDAFEELKEGQFVRILGRIWGEGDDIEVQADIIQDFTKIDKELYKKVFS